MDHFQHRVRKVSFFCEGLSVNSSAMFSKLISKILIEISFLASRTSTGLCCAETFSRPVNVSEHTEIQKCLNGARNTQARELATKCLESSSPRICPFPAQRVSGASASRAVALVRLQTPAIVWRRTRAAEPKSGLCANGVTAISSNAC